MAAKRGSVPAVDPGRRPSRLAVRSAPPRRPQAGRAQGAPAAVAADRRQRRPPRRPRRRRRRSAPTWPPTTRCPTPPFWGTRVVKGIPLADYAALLDERATFLGQWGLRGARGGKGPSYEELVETEGRPRLRYWLDRFQTRDPRGGRRLRLLPVPSARATTWSCSTTTATERARFTFPRQRRDRRLCLADFFRAQDSGETRRGRLPGRHDGPADQRVRRRAVRGQRLPRLPRGARAVGAADRGAGRVLAPPGPGGAAASVGGGPRRPRGLLQASATGARATRSATRPVPTWRTGQGARAARLRAGSACSCRRSSSCTRSSPPTAIVVHHPEAKYFAT